MNVLKSLTSVDFIESIKKKSAPPYRANFQRKWSDG